MGADWDGDSDGGTGIMDYLLSSFRIRHLFEDDTPRPKNGQRRPIPRCREDDYGKDAIERRWSHVREETGTELDHVKNYSFDPSVTRGNIENFIGVVQVPIGVAGPLLVRGEKANGEFVVPMATTEGALLASYNRGMKMLSLSGGATCTVVEDTMQRAPVFIFENAREGRLFVSWLQENMEDIRRQAEATSRHASLIDIDTSQVSKMVYARFNFRTGDAAGQNMVSVATQAAVKWITSNSRIQIVKAHLTSQFESDKKTSVTNTVRSRGKRVIAEATIPKEVLQDGACVTPQELVDLTHVGTMGSFFSGSTSNSVHAVNAITAMFIATGQDVANVAEASSGLGYAETTPKGDFYISITLPSLIVATHGGGTALPCQQECLKMMGCTGEGTAVRLAEIVGATVLAGELSLLSAVCSSDW
eukprot:CAMPEP_0198348528 /NCGR_PEP_ID=MMETSP1450-20131203/90190_1 /TAXON_ID=753684 ORGANISM="Madagascaria erythrocladiodes, Strain CCMP3234" /NCGR_SAMPLE_ID=MMETSP1450 /ASSEMBLY_ACC=CAM_ASM_001115 /LENGTH=417 /DNA_ID=CAMNT_0044054151 /DNA_START=146 /DNA_END=1396 /DNA_ORIENTATION=-